jgi:hypothetical protein
VGQSSALDFRVPPIRIEISSTQQSSNRGDSPDLRIGHDTENAVSGVPPERLWLQARGVQRGKASGYAFCQSSATKW